MLAQGIIPFDIQKPFLVRRHPTFKQAPALSIQGYSLKFIPPPPRTNAPGLKGHTRHNFKPSTPFGLNSLLSQQVELSPTLKKELNPLQVLPPIGRSIKNKLRKSYTSPSKCDLKRANKRASNTVSSFIDHRLEGSWIEVSDDLPWDIKHELLRNPEFKYDMVDLCTTEKVLTEQHPQWVEIPEDLPRDIVHELNPYFEYDVSDSIIA